MTPEVSARWLRWEKRGARAIRGHSADMAIVQRQVRLDGALVCVACAARLCPGRLPGRSRSRADASMAQRVWQGGTTLPPAGAVWSYAAAGASATVCPPHHEPRGPLQHASSGHRMLRRPWPRYILPQDQPLLPRRALPLPLPSLSGHPLPTPGLPPITPRAPSQRNRKQRPLYCFGLARKY